MPDLTPEQKKQLDSNIRMMLDNGASEDDLMAYANDYRSKFEVKKKESGGALASGGPSTLKTGALNGIKVKYATGVQPVQAPAEREAAEDDPVGQMLSPIKKQIKLTAPPVAKESTYQKGVLPEQKTRLHPEKESRDAISVYNAAHKMIYDNLDGELAKELLTQYQNDYGGQLPQNNETVNLALKRAAQYDNLVGELKGKTLKDAALQSYIKEDQHLAEQLKATNGEIPQALEGAIVKNFLIKNYKDLSTLAQANPETRAEFLDLTNNLYKKYPGLGIKEVSEKISQARQAAGKNGLVATWTGGSGFEEENNKLAEGLFKNDPQSKWIYDTFIKDDQERYIKAGGFANAFAQGIKNNLEGMGRTLGTPFKSKADNVYGELKKESESFSTGATGAADALNNMGEMTGFVASLGAVGNAAGGLGIPSGIASKSSVATTFFGDELTKAQAKFPDSNAKALLSAGLNTAAFATLSDIFPASKVGKVLGNFRGEVNSGLEKITGEAIDKAAANEVAKTAFQKAVNYGSDFLQQHTKSVAEMTGLTAFNQAIDRLLGVEAPGDPDDELAQTAKSFAIGNIIPSAIAAKGEYNKRSITRLDLAKEAIAKLDSDNPYASVLKSVIDDDGKLSTFLKDIADQAHDERSATTTKDVFGKEIVDIAKSIFPKEEAKEQPVDLAVEKYPVEEQTPVSGVEGGDVVVDKPKVRVSAEQLEERQPEKIRERYVDDFNLVEDSKFDWMVTSKLSSADRKKAVSDIKAGKDTAAARKLNKEIDETIQRGTVIINRGRGTQAATVEIPINEWFKFTPIEHDKAIKAAESAPDEIISIIRDNDITLDNIDSLKELFNGFPYDETDFNNVKAYFQGEATRNAEITRVGEQGQAQEIIQPTPKEQSTKVEEQGEVKDAEYNGSTQQAENKKENITSQNKISQDASDILTGKKVFERFSPQEQRGITEGGAVHVEATLHLAADERTGGKDNATPEAQENRIETFAKEKGIWTNNTTEHFTEKYGEPIGAGEEAIVWGDEKNGKVIKTQDTFQYDNLQQKLDGITLHNSYFPEAPIKVVGFGKNAKGEFQVIVEQPFIQGEKLTPSEIKTHLESIGFKEDENGNFSNGETIIEDVHTGNAIKTPEGNIVVIDPIMRLNTPEQGYGGQRKLSNNIKEPTENKTKNSGTVPPEEPPTTEVIAGEGDKMGGITHAATQETTRKAGLPDYEGHTPVTHEERIAAAKEAIAANPNIANEIMGKVEAGGNISPQDNAVLAVYKGALDKELESNPSKELFDRISRLAKVLNPEGTYAGQLLESRKLIDFNEDNLSNFLIDKEAAQGAPLSDSQIKSETAKYEELKKQKEALEKQLQQEREQYAKDIAELGFNKAKAKAKRESKKTADEYKKERAATVEAAREALRKLRESGELKSTIPIIAELKAIGPHVKDYLQSLLNQGIDKLDVAVSEIHAEFKDVLEGLSKGHIIEILAGEHDAAKKEATKNQKANAIHLLQREAALIRALEKARKGEEAAKSEAARVQANRRIEELTQKIKEVREQNKKNDIDEAPNDMAIGEGELNAALEKKLLAKAKKLQEDIKNKRYLEETPPAPVFKKSRKVQILEDRVIDLENKIRHERSVDEYRKRSKARKVYDRVMEVVGLKRLVQTAVDISVPFRQGATLISPRNIDIWAKGFMANVKSVFNQKKFDRIMYDIRHDPMYHDMIKDRVVFNDLGSADPNLHNEDFRKSFIYKVPILSEPLKASNRSADAFLNVSRYEMYKKLRNRLESQGLTRESDPQAFKYIGNWTMSMTGRGRMTNMLENSVAHTVLGNTFYGARLMASRFNLLNPVTYFDSRIPRQAKMEALKDITSWVATTMTIGAALALATGAKISLDPDDSDFLQLRYGKKVYDVSGGLATYIRTFLRIVKAAHTKVMGTKYEGKKATENAGQSTLNFFRNKLAPNTAYVTDAFFGKAYGQEFDPYDIANIYPMYADDVIESLKQDGVIAIPTVLLPNIVGIGYGSYASKGQIDTNLEDLLERNLRSDEMNNQKIINHKKGGRPVTFEEFNQFADKRDAEIKKDLEALYKKGINGIPYEKLTAEQLADEVAYIKSHATMELKKGMFGEDKKTSTEKRQEDKLQKARKKLYK